ncbi:MAG: hypothetical protein V9G19_24255 [Tetrasphaera sp.]
MDVAAESMRQLRTWNLSQVVAARAGGRAVVVKATAPFLGDEPRAVDLLGRFAPGVAVPVLARDPTLRIMVMPDLPEDHHGESDPKVLAEMVDRWSAAQLACAPGVQEFLAIGRDLRAEAVLATADRVVAAVSPSLNGAERRALDQARASLGTRLDRLAKCGIPDSIVHGDLHPGNWFGPPGGLRRTALHLLEPVRLWLAADLFGGFLRQIEPSEAPYHAADPPALAQALIRHAN